MRNIIRDDKKCKSLVLVSFICILIFITCLKKQRHLSGRRCNYICKIEFNQGAGYLRLKIWII